MPRIKKKYPLKSTPAQLKKAVSYSNTRIKKKLGTKKYKKMNRFLGRVNSDFNFSTVTPQRKENHINAGITSGLFRNKNTIDTKDPDLYVTAGIAGSGKSMSLKRDIKEPAVDIDSDNFKQTYSKHYPSPAQGYNLAHAYFFHATSKELSKKAINKALAEGRNVIFDTTANDINNVRGIIAKFKAAGYDIHLMGTQRYPHKSIYSVTKRFIDGNVKYRRYVPLNVVAKNGNQINENVFALRKSVDSHVIKDTNDFKNIKTITKRGSLTKNYRDPKKNQFKKR